MKSLSSHKPDFHAIFDAVPGLYLILKPDLSILDASDAYLEATQTVRNNIINKFWYEVFPDNPSDTQAHGVKTINDSFHKVLKTKKQDIMGVVKYDIPSKHDGKQTYEARYWSIVNCPSLDADGQVAYIINSVIDVTEFVELKQEQVIQTKITEQLKQQNKLFQTQMQQTVREIAAHKKNEAELRRLNKIKSEFIAAVSHHLRTPLTAIKWSSEVLLKPKHRLTKSRQEHYLYQIHASNERMIELVKDLLDVSKIDFGSMTTKPEPVNLSSILKQVLDDTAAQSASKEVGVTTSVDRRLPPIFIDPAWVRVIFQNVLTNSIRYSKPGQQVTIQAKKESNGVLISISDQGCGIPMGQQNKIFTKFFRADNARRLVSDGSGLGLYITKAMVEQAHGKIWFDSAESKGSTFYVKLPFINNTPAEEVKL